MKLKDKKIDLCQVQYVSDAIGNRTKKLVTVDTVWAYFRQLSMNEIYVTTTQIQEEVLFQINYRADLTTDYSVRFRGVEYDITRIDTFEGYKSDLILYCKRKTR